MVGNQLSKTLRRFIDMKVIENKYEFTCNLYLRVLCVIDCSVVISEDGYVGKSSLLVKDMEIKYYLSVHFKL